VRSIEHPGVDGLAARRARARTARTVSLPDAVVEALTEGVLVLTPTGQVVQANVAAHTLLSAGGPDDLVGRDAALHFDHTTGSQGRRLGPAENPLRTCLRTGRVIRHKLVGLQQPDGTTLWLDVTVTPISVTPISTAHSAPGADARPSLVDGVLVVIRRPGADDATVTALRDREHQLSVAQRMARLSMWRWDTGRDAVEWLDGAGRGMGITGESKGMSDYLDGIHPDDRPGHDAMLRELVTGRLPQGEIDLRYRWEQGWRHWHLWAEAVVDSTGQVTGLWGTTQEVTARTEAEAAVRRLSMTDSLTELANRAQVLEQITAALVECPPQLEVGLVLVDIDRFSHVNARFGPSAGDLLLIEVGRRLARLAGLHRTPGRLGADTFALVLERSSAQQVRDLAKLALTDLNRPYELTGVGEPVHVTVSIGSALSDRSAPHSTSELLRQAEIAVSFSQAAGGGQGVLFDQTVRSQVLSRLDMEGRLRAALDSGGVFAVYQPVITLGDGPATDRITSCEALARMTEPGGLVPPSEFVGVAEENGLILDLDLAVFTTAVRQVLVHPPLPGFGLATNFSPLSLQAPGLVDRVAAALADAGLDGRSLRIEITEGCLAEPTPQLLGHLHGLRELGARIGLDDFGTGYSALAYLSRFELDFIKIDRSFVSNLCTEPRSRAIVRAVIDLAHAHDLTVVAEGIETASQLEALRDMQCDMVQGYYLGRPMMIDALLARATQAPAQSGIAGSVGGSVSGSR